MKPLFKNPPNYDFVIFAIITYSLFLYAVIGWFFLVPFVYTLLVIIVVIIIFLQFSLYETSIFKNGISQRFLLRFYSKSINISDISIQKIEFRSTTGGTGYFHIYYMKQGNERLYKKSILAKNVISKKKSREIVNVLQKNGIEIDGLKV